MVDVVIEWRARNPDTADWFEPDPRAEVGALVGVAVPARR
jgi:hypothetical protein